MSTRETARESARGSADATSQADSAGIGFSCSPAKVSTLDATPECEHPMHDDDCPHGCEAPRVCEYCGGPATDERSDRGQRIMLVCDSCAEDLDRAERRRRDEDARESAIDQKLSEWKDGGR